MESCGLFVKKIMVAGDCVGMLSIEVYGEEGGGNGGASRLTCPSR